MPAKKPQKGEPGLKQLGPPDRAAEGERQELLRLLAYTSYKVGNASDATAGRGTLITDRSSRPTDQLARLA